MSRDSKYREECRQVIPKLRSPDVLGLRLPEAVLARISGSCSPRISRDPSLRTTDLDIWQQSQRLGVQFPAGSS